MPTTPLPVVPGGLLDELHRLWDDHGWQRKDLEAFRMGPDPDPDPDPDDDPDDDDPDDDKGKGKDADARIAKANKEAAERRRELKPWKDLAKKHNLTAEQVEDLVAKSKATPKPDDPKDDKPTVDPDALRRDIEKETTAKANRRIVRSEVKAIAADLFADPADAPLYLDLDDYDVDDEGEVDEDQIREDLKALLKRKPHLAKAGEGEPSSSNGRRRPKPDRAQGTRGKPAAGDGGRAEAERRFGKAKAPASAS